MTPVKRRTLGTYGRRGDRVRVLIDATRDRVEVLFRDADGIDRKRIFGNDKAGRAEALAWAETFHQERAKRLAEKTAPKPITMRQLWREYTQSPAWHDLRDASRPNYADRWRLWVRFIGEDAIAGDVRLLDVDRFIVRMREIPTANGAPRAINQIRQVLNVVRTVFNWAQSRELLTRNDFALFRWKRPKDARALEPEEYTAEEFARLLAAASPQDARTWRIHVALILAGVHGQRARSVLHLRWADVAGGMIRWPGEFMKQGEDHAQPLTWEALAALETARYWTQERQGRDFTRQSARQRAARAALAASPWVLPGHGDTTKPWGYQAAWKALKALETSAGVPHKAFRAWHGMRKMASGNVSDATGDARLGLEWIGDRDMSQAKSYLKQRADRMARAADAAVEPQPSPIRSSAPKHETAPVAADAATSTETGSYESDH